MNYDRYKALNIEKKDAVLTITIDRPEARNAVNPQMHEEFSHIFLDAGRDPEVSVVVLTGSGDAFSAGGDIDWLLALDGDLSATAASIENDRRIQNALLDLEKPIIARVVGPAVGLGCSLALFCDFVYATPDARFADPHVAIALVAGDGGAVIWPQLVGYARARKYLLTGDPISGSEAADIGLITEAVPREQIDETVDAMAKRMANAATLAVKWTKSSINAGLKVTANAIIDRAAAYENLSMLTEDHRIAVEAFSTRSKPQFVGR